MKNKCEHPYKLLVMIYDGETGKKITEVGCKKCNVWLYGNQVFTPKVMIR